MGFVARRAAASLVTTLAAVLVVFVALRVLPNNPALAQFGQRAVPEQVQAEMARRGWDQPLVHQLGRFLRDLVTRGDLGESFYFSNESVAAGLARTFPATVELAVAALVIAIPLGLGLGVAAAVWRNRWPDLACTAGALLGVSVPVFCLGIVLMYAFPWMPSGRRLPLGLGFESQSGLVLLESLVRGRWDVAGAALRHVCLPALALSSIPMAIIARVTRTSMLEVLSADYVRTARAKGSAPRQVVLRHALPNAAVPIVSIAGLQVGQLLTGAVLTESVFNWPGLGRHLVEAVLKSDYAVVQGATLVVAAVFVSTNLLVDLVQVLVDPRMRHAGGG